MLYLSRVVNNVSVADKKRNKKSKTPSDDETEKKSYQEIVVADFNALGVGQRLIQGETGAGQQDVVALVAEHTDAHVQGSGASTGNDHILGSQGSLGKRKLVSDGLTGMQVTSRWWVSVALVRVQLLGDSVCAGLMDLEVAKQGGVTKSERDHGLVGIGLDLDVIDNGTDGVGGALGDDGGVDLPG